jgi:hypothetical protein
LLFFFRTNLPGEGASGRTKNSIADSTELVVVRTGGCEQESELRDGRRRFSIKASFVTKLANVAQPRYLPLRRRFTDSEGIAAVKRRH